MSITNPGASFFLSVLFANEIEQLTFTNAATSPIVLIWSNRNCNRISFDFMHRPIGEQRVYRNKIGAKQHSTRTVLE